MAQPISTQQDVSTSTSPPRAMLAVAGAGLGAAYAYAPTLRRREVGIVATVVASVLVVGLAVLKYAGV